MNIRTKKQVGEERVYSVYIPHHRPSLKESEDRFSHRARIWKWEPMQRP